MKRICMSEFDYNCLMNAVERLSVLIDMNSEAVERYENDASVSDVESDVFGMSTEQFDNTYDDAVKSLAYQAVFLLKNRIKK